MMKHNKILGSIQPKGGNYSTNRSKSTCICAVLLLDEWWLTCSMALLVVGIFCLESLDVDILL